MTEVTAALWAAAAPWLLSGLAPGACGVELRLWGRYGPLPLDDVTQHGHRPQRAHAGGRPYPFGGQGRYAAPAAGEAVPPALVSPAGLATPCGVQVRGAVRRRAA